MYSKVSERNGSKVQMLNVNNDLTEVGYEIIIQMWKRCFHEVQTLNFEYFVLPLNKDTDVNFEIASWSIKYWPTAKCVCSSCPYLNIKQSISEK